MGHSMGTSFVTAEFPSRHSTVHIHVRTQCTDAHQTDACKTGLLFRIEGLAGP